MSEIANAICVDDDLQSIKNRCAAGDVSYTFLTSGLKGGAIVVCRTAEDAERLLALYGLRSHRRGRDDHC